MDAEGVVLENEDSQNDPLLSIDTDLLVVSE